MKFIDGFVLGFFVGLGLAVFSYGLYNHWDNSTAAGAVIAVTGAALALIITGALDGCDL